VNWDVSIVGIKFLSGSGGGTWSAAVAAIDYATKLGVNLTSNSWGGRGESKALFEAVERSQKAGILFVAAAGNSSANVDKSPFQPAGYSAKLDNVLTVAATDSKDKPASFTNYGKKTVHLAAPGVGILSTVPGNKYAKLSGTSMAAPHVAGAAALVLSVYPDLDYKELKKRLVYSVDRVATLKKKVITGGRMNLARALEKDDAVPGMASDVKIVRKGGTSIDLTWKAAGDDGNKGYAPWYEVRIADEAIKGDGWEKATPVDLQYEVDVRAGLVTASITGLKVNSKGYLAIRAMDKVGNWGLVSTPVEFATAELQVAFINPAETLKEVMVEGDWGLEKVEGREGFVFSDTPEGKTQKYKNFSLTMDPISITDKELMLAFESRTALGEYSKGVVEVLVNTDAGWEEAIRLSGAADWRTEMVDLTRFLSDDVRRLQIRFRIQTSYKEGDGWLVDNIKLLKAKPEDL
jgi:hypothetical protein